VSLICIGVNHRSAPVGLLERLAVPAVELPKALHHLLSGDHVAEAAVLSTCNRTEVYARCTRFHGAVADVRAFLAAHSGADPAEVDEHLYTYYDDGAVAHLFGVAAGLDSMIVGEGEILRQVRSAWQAAEAEGAAGQVVSRAFRHALAVGKRARTETGIARHALSVSSAAVALASDRLGSLGGRSVLVLGAGDMAEGMVQGLVGAGVGSVTVANRTHARAVQLARRVGGQAIALSDVLDSLLGADVLLTATDSPNVHVTADDIEAVMDRRPGRPLLIADIAVPRDVDPGAASVPGVTLLDIDDLRGYGERSMALRRREIGRVQGIVTDELDRFRVERSAREVAPVVVALRDRAEAVRRAEMERFRSRLAGLDPAQRRAVEGLTQGIVKKLLHSPTVRLKEAAGSARGDLYTDAVASLFDLDDLGLLLGPPALRDDTGGSEPGS